LVEKRVFLYVPIINFQAEGSFWPIGKRQWLTLPSHLVLKLIYLVFLKCFRFYFALPFAVFVIAAHDAGVAGEVGV
jgi:hypothetical protein